jgi:hypothetical protein
MMRGCLFWKIAVVILAALGFLHMRAMKRDCPTCKAAMF